MARRVDGLSLIPNHLPLTTYHLPAVTRGPKPKRPLPPPPRPLLLHPALKFSERLHIATHLIELFDQCVHFFHRRPRTGRYALSPGAVHDVGISALLWRHAQN